MPPAILVVTGASGSGKTATVRALDTTGLGIDAAADALVVHVEIVRAERQAAGNKRMEPTR
jgi:predicted ATPase